MSVSLLLQPLFPCVSAMPVYAADDVSVSADESVSSDAGISADDNLRVVTISDAKELEAFAEQCHVDTYSHDLKVVLANDIVLTGSEFTGIPIFSGHFDGDGHTISSYRYGGDGYVTGFFRYLSEDAVVENLTLNLTVTAEGKQSVTGGIAGINRGSIINCTVSGRIKGKNDTGGIVGINEASGTVTSCRNEAQISGFYCTGGISGKNYGLISKCSNIGNINDSVEWVEEEDEMGGDILSGLTDVDSVSQVRLRSGIDTGGIAGYSKGVILACSNEAVIGYEHAGYNVGGIAGRQCGSMNGCVNNGEVYGRKDIGGIVGQMEPYLQINDRDSIRQAINELHDMVNSTLNMMDANNEKIRADMDDLQRYADAAVDTGSDMSSSATDYISANTDVANDAGGRVSDVTEMLPKVVDNISAAGDRTRDLADTLRRTNEELEISGRISAADRERADACTDDIERQSELLQAYSDGLQENADRLSQMAGEDASNTDIGTVDGNTLVVSDGSWIVHADGSKEKIDTPTALSDGDKVYLTEALTTSAEGYYGEYEGDGRFRYRNGNYADGDVRRVRTSDQGTDRTAYADIAADMAEQMSGSLTAISRTEEDLSELYSIYEKYVSDAVDDTHKNADQALDEMRDTMDSLDKAQEGVSDITSYLNAGSDLQLVQVDRSWDGSVDRLHSELDGMSDTVGRLSDHAGDYSEEVNDNLRAINDQINRIYSMADDRVSQLTDNGFDDVYTDVSEVSILTATLGKVASCVNYGEVRGDINIGGVTGAMALDEDDPESNAAGTVEFSIGQKYTSQNILHNCTNRGYVTAKGDGVGCVVGYMSHGVVDRAYAYGVAESTGGNYVGGVAGQSMSTIQNSYVLCAIAGGEYVGGVAGYGHTIRNCYAMPTIGRYTGKCGAVAGQIEIEEDTEEPHLESVTDNRYVSDLFYGIDGISYGGSAESMSYEALIRTPGTPVEFRYLTVTFRVDDLYLGAQQIAYGAGFDSIVYPEIPYKTGYYGRWPEQEEGTIQGNLVITAEYVDAVRVLGSGNIDTESGKVLGYVDSEFNDTAGLIVQQTHDIPFTGDAMATENVVYRVSLVDMPSGADGDYQIRLYNPLKGKHLVWYYDGSTWSQVDYADRGSYVQITMHGTDGVFAIEKQPLNIELLIIVSVIIAAVILIIVLIVIRKKKRKKKSGKTGEKKGKDL